MLAVGISDRGKVRANNEDWYTIYGDEPLALYAVADGMGGHAAGEVASKMALDILQGYLQEHRHTLLEIAGQGKSLRPFLEDMLALANEMVWMTGLKKTEYNGMGTTLTLLVSVLGCRWLAHIGDSRAYLLSKGQLQLLTEDHTLVSQLIKTGQIIEAEAGEHPQRHILTRALGTDESALFDIIPLELQHGDRLILCTDGLHGLVSDTEVLEIITQDISHQDIVGQLVQTAKDKGGSDNITVILLENE